MPKRKTVTCLLAALALVVLLLVAGILKRPGFLRAKRAPEGATPRPRPTCTDRHLHHVFVPVAS